MAARNVVASGDTVQAVIRAAAVRRKTVETILGFVCRCVESAVGIGNALIYAKAQIPYGSFEEMIREDLGWDPSTAQRFMSIASHPVVSDPARARALPAAWSSLYELSRFEPSRLLAAIGSGDVNSNMTRAKVIELRDGASARAVYSIFSCPNCGKPTMQLWHTLHDPAVPQIERLYRCVTCEEVDPDAAGLRCVERVDGPYHKKSLG